jgi:quinolinate synthase
MHSLTVRNLLNDICPIPLYSIVNVWSLSRSKQKLILEDHYRKEAVINVASGTGKGYALSVFAPVADKNYL